MSDCPKCGYPTKGCFKGIYRAGEACSGCGFTDARPRMLDELLDRKLKDPTNLPNLLKYGADFLEDWGKNRGSPAPSDMLRRCARIMYAARDHLCESSTEQNQESSNSTGCGSRLGSG